MSVITYIPNDFSHCASSYYTAQQELMSNLLYKQQIDNDYNNFKKKEKMFSISEKMDLIFNNARFYDPENDEKPQENMFNPPLNRFWTYLNVDYLENNVNIMSRIIGTKGSVFKAITLKSEVDYIYYLKDVKQIWIFGYSILDTEYCKQLLLQRIDLVLKNL